MKGLFRFMASPVGRGVRIVLGLALIAVGLFAVDGVWSWVLGIIISLLVYRGYYQSVEKLCLIMMALFTLVTVACVAFLQFTEYAITWANVAEGLEFKLPAAAVGVAMEVPHMTV